MEGIKSQLTAAFAAVFVVVNAFWPELMTVNQEKAVVGVLVALYGVFMAWKVERKG